jgi:hypothetical protein
MFVLPGPGGRVPRCSCVVRFRGMCMCTMYPIAALLLLRCARCALCFVCAFCEIAIVATARIARRSLCFLCLAWPACAWCAFKTLFFGFLLKPSVQSAARQQLPGTLKTREKILYNKSNRTATGYRPTAGSTRHMALARAQTGPR